MIEQALALINNYICTNQIEKAKSTLKMVKELQPEHEAYQDFDQDQPCELYGEDWRYQDLNGKSLEIFCDHGMGDTVMMFRYIKKLKESFDVKIILNSLQYYPLKRLIDGLDFVDIFTKNHEGCDFHTNIMQLPQIYHEILVWPTIPRYTKKPIPEQPLLLSTIKTTFDVKMFDFGLKYETNPQSELFWKKSIRPEEIPNWNYVSLEPHSLRCTDIAELMAVMAQLPVIVSVDTLTLHLAGSMGLRTIGLLCSDADPRWGKEEKTPWYPSVTLLRQEKAGVWEKVLESTLKLLTL